MPQVAVEKKRDCHAHMAQSALRGSPCEVAVSYNVVQAFRTNAASPTLLVHFVMGVAFPYGVDLQWRGQTHGELAGYPLSACPERSS